MYHIDTNIFLEVLLNQERRQECTDFLSLVWKGDLEAIVTDFSVYGIALKIESQNKNTDDIRTWFKSLFAYKGLQVHTLSTEEKIAATFLMEQYLLDFDDAIQVQGALSNGVAEIISFDPDFDTVKEIRRLEPKDILAQRKE